MGQINIDKKYCKTLGAQDERTKQEYAAWDKDQHHQKKHAKSENSHAQNIYNQNGQKAEMNVMVQQASEAAIYFFVKKT